MLNHVRLGPRENRAQSVLGGEFGDHLGRGQIFVDREGLVHGARDAARLHEAGHARAAGAGAGGAHDVAGFRGVARRGESEQIKAAERDRKADACAEQQEAAVRRRGRAAASASLAGRNASGRKTISTGSLSAASATSSIVKSDAPARRRSASM